MTNFLTGVKHKFRDLIIWTISFLGLSFLYQVYLRRRGPLVRILCFHDVADVSWFEQVIKMISKNYHLITPEEFHLQKFNSEKINILLTFDDGYQSWVDNCLPVLKKYELKGLFFVTSGLLDLAADTDKVATYMKERLLITPKKPLTWEGAKQLVEAGHTIGGHTVTHPNLAKLSEAEAKEEIMDDKYQLESKLELTLDDFAYPFGTENYINQSLLNLTKTVYPYQYSAVTGFYSVKNIKLIPRTLIEKNQPISQVKNWIGGSYDIFYILK